MATKEMATITKTHTKKDKATGEKTPITTTYVIDPKFVPTKVSEICSEFIEAYCEANGAVEWLLDKYEATITDKDGKVRPYPSNKIKTDFCEKFFPALVTKKGEKKVSNRVAFLKKYGRL